MRERGRGEGVRPQDEPSIYTAWRAQQSRRLADPATAPFGGPRNHAAWRTQQSHRLASPATVPLGEASVYPAWCVANLKFCTEKSLPPLAGEGGRRPEGGIKNQDLSRLANPATMPLGEPSNHAAWRAQQPRRLANPATTPLGGSSNRAAWRAQQSRCLTGQTTPPIPNTP